MTVTKTHTPTLFTDGSTQTIVAILTSVVWPRPAGSNGSTRCICRVRPSGVVGGGNRRGGSGEMTVIGDIADPKEGQEYEFEGTVGHNERYNCPEMKLTSYRTRLPDSAHGIKHYLTNVAKWVGPTVADRLVESFGDDTLNVIKSDPERIAATVSGITIDRAREMQASLAANEKFEKATIEVAQLCGGVVSASIVARAVKKWGSTAGAKIRRNPFVLTQLRGVGFLTADAVYKRLGMAEDAGRRHVAVILHVLDQLHFSDGHTAIDAATIRTTAEKLVGKLHLRAIELAIRSKRVRVVGEQRVDFMGGRVAMLALPEIFDAETNVAGKLVSLATLSTATDGPARDGMDIAATQGAAVAKDGVLTRSGAGVVGASTASTYTDGLAPDQLEAFAAWEQSRVFILTGGPGTGKTYTTARMVRALQAMGYRMISLCAPTGKAAKQMTSALAAAGASGYAAVTIHRLLKPGFDEETQEFSFGHNENDPLKCDALVVDESSMIDIRLAWSLLRAVRHGTRVLFVGDRHQLPSIGPGSVLRDMIAAGIPSYELTEIKRNAGRIVRACHEIKDGKVPASSPGKLDLPSGENWRHFEAGDAGEVIRIIEQLYTTGLPSFGRSLSEATGAAFSTFSDVQCLAPLNEKGRLSVNALNRLLQPILNPGRNLHEKMEFAVGDRIVRTKNGQAKRAEPMRNGGGDAGSDDDGVCGDSPDGFTSSGHHLSPGGSPRNANDDQVPIVNGDLGVVRDITVKGTIIVEFANPTRWVSLNKTDHCLKLAYCMTCHKLQGSEAPVIVMPLHKEFTNVPLLTREWVYTAMSRAKIALVTVGTIASLEPVVRRVGNDKRRTMLGEWIKGRLRV